MSKTSPTATPAPVLPDSIGLIVLEDCFHFPYCFLPLFIFEQRYRQMLDFSLQTSRMFCVGTQVQGKLLPIATAGLVRTSKLHENGTSHVMLQGLRRIRFKNWLQEKPFRVAQIEPLDTRTTLSTPELDSLKHRAIQALPPTISTCGESARELRQSLPEITCPEVVCDLLSFYFVNDPQVQAQLLTEPSLEARYQTLIEYLES